MCYGPEKKFQNLIEISIKCISNPFFFSVKNVVILICDDRSFSPKDEEIVSRTIEDIIIRTGKGLIAWLKNGRLSVDHDVLVQLLKSLAPEPSAEANPFRGFQKLRNRDSPCSVAESFSTYSGQSQGDPLQNSADWQSGHGWNTRNKQQPTRQAAATNQQMHTPATSENGEPVLLRTILRHGKVSMELEDLQMWDPDFTVPERISKMLFQKYQGVPEAGLRIVLDNNSEPQCYVSRELKEFSRKKEIQMERNETLLLKTRLRYGQASFKENDVHFRYANWQIPPHIVGNLKEEHKSTPGADVIISLKDGKLHCRVKIGQKDKITNFVSRELNLA